MPDHVLASEIEITVDGGRCRAGVLPRSCGLLRNGVALNLLFRWRRPMASCRLSSTTGYAKHSERL